jgi:hypothetical protein
VSRIAETLETLEAFVRRALGRRRTLAEHSALPSEGLDMSGREVAVPTDLSLGCDAAGVSYVLNFETGAIDSALPKPQACDGGSATIYPLRQVTADLIAAICERGGYLTHRDDDGDVCIHTNIGHVVLVPIGADKDMLWLSRSFFFNDDVSTRDRVKLVRRLNAGGVITRYSIINGVRLMAEYEFLITAGLHPAQFLATLRAFAAATECQLDSCKAGRLLR